MRIILFLPAVLGLACSASGSRTSSLNLPSGSQGMAINLDETCSPASRGRLPKDHPFQPLREGHMRTIASAEAHRLLLHCEPAALDFHRYRIALVSFPPHTNTIALGQIDRNDSEIHVRLDMHPVCSGPAPLPQASTFALLLEAGEQPVLFSVRPIAGPLCLAP